MPVNHMIEFYDLMPDKPEKEFIKKIDITLTTLGLEDGLIKDIIISTNNPEARIFNRFNSNRKGYKDLKNWLHLQLAEDLIK